ncbi:MAG: esterase [Bryobacterales bacterium]|nr:esterase [Bryobacterales bacterium]
MTRFLLVLCVAGLCSAEENRVAELARQARGNPAEFRQAVLDALGAEGTGNGTAVLTHGEDFLWAVESASAPMLFVNEQRGPALRRGAGNLWYAFGRLPTGTIHSFHYLRGGERFGGRTDVPAYPPEAYEQPGVPKGKLTEKRVHTSRLYPGMKSDYWVWAPAQYDPATPAALMVWQDGEQLADRFRWRSQIVFENLTHQKKIPIIVHVFISPGFIGEERVRSQQYDVVNDTFARFLRDEILPEVYKDYSIRRDGYSRAIAGDSSGGICAFNAAWHQPDQFSRVLSRIGSFTSIRWLPGVIEGGNVYPFKIRKEPKRNIRVWLQAAAGDLENSHGSWPLQNIQMANSLKMMDYDFRLSWGQGTHNRAHGAAEVHEEMVWLWRGYDPAKTAAVYEQDPAERGKPMFRVSIANR